MPRMITTDSSTKAESRIESFSVISSLVYSFWSFRYFLNSTNNCWRFSILLSSANIIVALLVVVGTVNYQLSRKSLLETSKEFTAYEQAQNEKNTDTDDKEEVKVVDSKENQVEEKVTEASKQIEKQLTSEKNMKKATYILDMKMTREKQRNSLTQDLNEMINNPSTSEEARKEFI